MTSTPFCYSVILYHHTSLFRVLDNIMLMSVQLLIVIDNDFNKLATIT